MEFDQIKELISLVDSTTVTDLEIERDGFKLKISKGQQAAKQIEIIEQKAAVSGEYLEQAQKPEPLSQETEGLLEITAPMVGTFYRAPAPDAQPYIQIGDTVEEGQVLFIIEAMKMMNEITADYPGVVRRILVENGRPVEYGQVMLLIEPLG